MCGGGDLVIIRRGFIELKRRSFTLVSLCVVQTMESTLLVDVNLNCTLWNNV